MTAAVIRSCPARPPRRTNAAELHPKAADEAAQTDGIFQEVATDILEIAKGGLRRRARLDHSGNDETSFLNPLMEIARTGLCPAETLLASFEGEWGGKVEPAFEALTY